MLRYQNIANNTDRLRALTSLEPDECTALVPAFEPCFLERMQAYTRVGRPRLTRRYTPYTNAPLPTIKDTLRVILVPIKQHRTQALQGQRFGMMQSDAHTWCQLLGPVLLHALEQVAVVPARRATVVVPALPPAATQAPFVIMLGLNVPSHDQ